MTPRDASPSAPSSPRPERARRPDRHRRLDRDHFDVVVVGSGIGGLTAGALAARHGKRVLVVEQHYVAGGNATVFKRRGYEFDVGLHYIGDCQPGGALPRILRAAGVRDVKFNPLDPDGFDTLVFPDLTFKVPAGLDAYRDRLVATFPSERAGIDRYVRLQREAMGLLSAGADLKKLVSRLPHSLLALRYATSTLGRFLDTCTSDPRLRAVLAAENGDYGQPPSRAALGLHVALMGHYLGSGAFYPAGGGQIMSDRLAESIEEHGGKILLSTPVERIVIERGRAVGVVIRNKHFGTRTVRADVVISNADLKQTMLRLVGPEHLPARLVRRTRSYEMSPALGVVYLGVRRDLRAEGTPNTNYWIYPSYDIESAYAANAAGRFLDEPFAYVSIASLKDPDNPKLAPDGVTNMQVMSLAPESAAAWGTTEAAFASGAYRKEPAYVAAKEAYRDRLLQSAERVFPGLRGQVELAEVSTSLTHRRYTWSSGGTSYGIALVPEQFLLHRPGTKTPIRGLLLAGASCRTGHGIMGAMMSGVMAAAHVAGPKVMKAALSRRSVPAREPRAPAATSPESTAPQASARV